ncbi:unnamed protein product [Pleuronectes platessa]|uniref:Uncharacterized protein n=1 Tax=Pleuronectes platessa TaxID=8262 RepID=A0A9N7VTL7_PLEPL|nr:unnamed protein product [Pleuronectes platessa]
MSHCAMEEMNILKCELIGSEPGAVKNELDEAPSLPLPSLPVSPSQPTSAVSRLVGMAMLDRKIDPPSSIWPEGGKQVLLMPSRTMTDGCVGDMSVRWKGKVRAGEQGKTVNA